MIEYIFLRLYILNLYIRYIGVRNICKFKIYIYIYLHLFDYLLMGKLRCYYILRQLLQLMVTKYCTRRVCTLHTRVKGAFEGRKSDVTKSAATHDGNGC